MDCSVQPFVDLFCERVYRSKHYVKGFPSVTAADREKWSISSLVTGIDNVLTDLFLCKSQL